MAKELTRQREIKIGEEEKEKITGEEGNKKEDTKTKTKTKEKERPRLNTKTGGPLTIAKRTRHNPDTSCISTQDTSPPSAKITE